MVRRLRKRSAELQKDRKSLVGKVAVRNELPYCLILACSYRILRAARLTESYATHSIFYHFGGEVICGDMHNWEGETEGHD
jgi:hypothetical protein